MGSPGMGRMLRMTSGMMEPLPRGRECFPSYPTCHHRTSQWRSLSPTTHYRKQTCVRGQRGQSWLRSFGADQTSQ